MCPIGGRACWHRSSITDPRDATRVRFAYNRLRFVFGVALAQAAGARPVPFDAGVRDLIRRVAPALAATRTPWIVGGSASAALQGVPLKPNDIDLATTEAGVAQVADALSEWLTEAPGRARWGPGAPRFGGRAFIGTFVDGVRAEWAEAEPDGPMVSEWSRAQLSAPDRAVVEGVRVPVAPLEFALVKAVGRDRADREAAILARLREVGVDHSLLDRVLEAASLPPPRADRLRDRVRSFPARTTGVAPQVEG